MGIQAAPANKAMSEGTAAGVMENLNLGYIQLGMVALPFALFRSGGSAVPEDKGTARKRKHIPQKNAVLDTNSADHVLSPFGDLARVTGEL